VLSQQNIKAGTYRYITAAEWPAYNLRSDVTVLSACETGLGKTISGEGVMGLPFALLVAGSVNTVLSLWPVADEATAEFMQRYFAKLKAGQTPAQALTNTKREFAKDARFGNPVYWAPFVLVGAG
jgi:CHAT domain-containing protein